MSPVDMLCGVLSRLRRAGPVLLLIAMLAGHAVAPQPAVADEPEAVNSPEVLAEIARLQELWNARDAKILSLRLSGHSFIGVGFYPKKGVPRPAMLAMVYDRLIPVVHQPDRSVAQLRAATEVVFPTGRRIDQGDGRAGTWDGFEYLEGAGGRRANTTVQGHDHVVVKLDGAEQRFDSNIQQATMFSSGSGISMADRRTFLYRPLLNEKFSNLRIEQTEERRRLSRAGGYTLEYDPDTGFVYLESLWFDGVCTAEQIQDLPVSVGDGIVLPGFCATIRYAHAPGSNEARVRLVKAYLLNLLEVNIPVAKEDFQMEVPAGTRVIDRGNPVSNQPEQLLITVASEPVADVVAFNEEAKKANNARLLRRPAVPRSGTWAMLFMACNIAALLAVGSWLLWSRFRT